MHINSMEEGHIYLPRVGDISVAKNNCQLQVKRQKLESNCRKITEIKDLLV